MAAEQKAKDDAEYAAATNRKVAEEVAKMKATMEEAARAKEVADAKAKFEAEVAAVQKAKDDEEKAKADAAAKEKYEADLKAKFEDEIKAAKAEADAAKALAAPPKEEKKKPIKFKDAVGRKFSFPYHLCQTWAVSFSTPSCESVLTVIGHGRSHSTSIPSRGCNWPSRPGWSLRPNWAEWGDYSSSSMGNDD